MKLITPQQFLMRQPSYPETMVTDPFYHSLSNDILKLIIESGKLEDYPEEVLQRLALAIVGYYQDIISDAGLWRSFINENSRLYDRKLPFFNITDDYIDYELNFEDIQFLVWYALSMNYDSKRFANPLSENFSDVSKMIYNHLDSIYDDSPDPVGYNLHSELELNNPEHTREAVKLGNWLFLHSYLLTPAYSLTLEDILSKLDKTNPDFMSELHKTLDESMVNDPTGPLALYLREWLYMVAENKRLPKRVESEEPKELHPTYIKFLEATKGSEIAFFNKYKELNDFFITSLGWSKDEEHLPQIKDSTDFVLLVNKHKGMLLARNVAKCIKCPQNPYYDRNYALEHSFDMLTVRGFSPYDLTKYCMQNGWLPDAHFPDSNDFKLVKDNFDFIARCYLQLYYRD